MESSLVVSQNPVYIDTIDDIYQRKELSIHMMKEHYILQYFKWHYGNPKLKVSHAIFDFFSSLFGRLY